MPISLLELRPEGLYCGIGDFYIDPWRPVPRAVITHGHADHARPGAEHYLAAVPGIGILRARLGDEVSVQGLAYGEALSVNGATVSLHPAGHILGSSQVRIEHRGECWVVSGDYKLEADSSCAPFEPIPCHSFISESTFALPIYRWPSQDKIFQEINFWWQQNHRDRRATVLYGYALGKAQRLLAGLDASIGPIYTHGSVERMTQLYRMQGVRLPATSRALSAKTKNFAGALIVAPPGMNGSAWLRRFGDCSTGMASGWMQVRGHRRRRAVDRGFVLSDHADWDGLLTAVRATGAETVWLTHGAVDPLVRWLKENGVNASHIETEFESEEQATAHELESDNGEKRASSINATRLNNTEDYEVPAS